MPDFVQVYSFIASAFDPDSGDLLQKLKEMDPIDVKTVWFVAYPNQKHIYHHVFLNFW